MPMHGQAASGTGTIPQVPLTLLNSVVAVCALSVDLFPHRPANPRLVAVSVALMNLVCCPLGAMPMCHGTGGLAGQHRFGARTGGSVVMLGATKMLLAVLVGTDRDSAFRIAARISRVLSHTVLAETGHATPRVQVHGLVAETEESAEAFLARLTNPDEDESLAAAG
ncbi:MAG: hypothetical protein HC829_07365, partial [Bacteroidales bacterium]|nr:hypothetical protein [Bacteroidales bacterium]